MNHPPIVPHLWFDKEAIAAAEFYVSLFPDARVTGKSAVGGTPSGNIDILRFTLRGQRFIAINAGPMFTINPSISFYVYCGSEMEIDRLYAALSEGGMALMPLDKYPWSGKYAWVQDKFGVTWQLDIDDVRSEQKIVPSLLFGGKKFDMVKPALQFYNSLFPGSKMLVEAPYDKSANVPEGTLLFGQCSLGGCLLNAMSSTMEHGFVFNEAVSLMVYCNDQAEIDYYWEKLSNGGQKQPCGWVKDRFGVSWQVVPAEMETMMATNDTDQLSRVMKAVLGMGKLDLQALRQAYSD